MRGCRGHADEAPVGPPRRRPRPRRPAPPEPARAAASKPRLETRCKPWPTAGRPRRPPRRGCVFDQAKEALARSASTSYFWRAASAGHYLAQRRQQRQVRCVVDASRPKVPQGERTSVPARKTRTSGRSLRTSRQSRASEDLAGSSPDFSFSNHGQHPLPWLCWPTIDQTGERRITHTGEERQTAGMRCSGIGDLLLRGRGEGWYAREHISSAAGGGTDVRHASPS